LKSFSLLHELSNTTKKRHEETDMILWINVMDIVDMEKKGLGYKNGSLRKWRTVGSKELDL